MRRIRKFAPAAIAGLVMAMPAGAQDVDVKGELNAIRNQLKSVREAYERTIGTLEQRIKTLEAENAARKRDAAARQVKGAARPNGKARRTGTAAGSGGDAFQIGLSTSVTGGGSSVGNDDLANLQRGDHDPNKNGFTVQSAELFVGGAVDPYFDAQANIGLKIDAEGETVIELEEAFARTRSLPFGLQVKAGQFYTALGRANPMHLHRWDFVDQPVILSRLLGPDGLRSQGVQLSWLTPLPWFSELTLGTQNSKGETAVSFLGEEGEEVGGFMLADRSVRNAADLLYTARWLNGFDLSETASVNLGFSAAVGPNASGPDNRTYLYGADIFAKWQPDSTHRGFPFIAFQAEAFLRNYEAGDPGDPNRQTLEDWGFYAQALWGFTPGWVAGLRVDHADSDGGAADKADDPVRDGRWRVSPNVTWFPTEFSKLRLQYNHDWAEHLDNQGQDGADTVWLQLQFSLGGHFAHTF